MTLLHATLAAAGLACVAIPIIIHLLMHRRRKPVMWGAMRFLLEAYRRQRRRLMLEKWVLLACRCLIIALVALALGRPLIGRLLGPGAGRTIYLLIDNSLTSGARAADGRTALERHKETARALVESIRAAAAVGGPAGEGDRIGLVALGGPAEPIVVPASPDLTAVLRLIDELEPTDSRADLAGGLRAVAQAMAPGPDGAPSAAGSAPSRTYVALVSDFLEGSVDLTSPGASNLSADENAAAGELAGLRLPPGVTLLATEPAPAAPPAPNVSITALEPLRAVVVGAEAGGAMGEGDEQVRITLRRSGADLPAATTTVRTRLVWARTGRAPGEDAPSPREGTATAHWSAGQETATVVAPLPRDEQAASGASTGDPATPTLRGQAGAIVAHIDPDAIAGDNAWRRPIEFREALRVGVIAPTRFGSGVSADQLDPGSWARLALAPTGAGGIEVVEIEPAALDAARLSGLDAVVIPRPDLVQDAGWSRLGLFAANGGVVVVTPPPGLSVHLWPDAMVRGLDLPAEWTLAREATTVEGARLVPGRGAGASVAPGAPAPASEAADPNGAASGLLALVEGELDELLRPVTVQRILPLESSGEAGRPVLRLESGEVVMWAGRPGHSAGGATAGRARGLVVYLGLALSLEWSDLPAKPLMVPLMQETVRQGIGQARGAWWTLAGTRPPTPAGAIELKPLAGAQTARRDDDDDAGPARITLTDDAGPPPLRRAGLFEAVDDRGATRAVVAVNPDARAGRVGPQPRDAVGAVLNAAIEPPSRLVWLPAEQPGAPAEESAATRIRGVMSGLLGSAEQGSPIDFPLLIAALALAVLEVFLARWASHAEVLPAAVRGAAGIISGGEGARSATGEAA